MCYKKNRQIYTHKKSNFTVSFRFGMSGHEIFSTLKKTKVSNFIHMPYFTYMNK